MVQVEFTHPHSGQQNTVQPGKTAQRYINPGRAQKLLNICDVAALSVSFTALFYYALLFLADDAAIIAAMFLAAEATYVCVMALRWIRIYDIDFLISITRGFLAATGIVILVGGSVVLIVGTSLFPVSPGSSLAWIAVISAYLLISRLLAGLWAKPLAVLNAFRQRIAIVGGGANAESAIEALDSSTDIDVEIVGMFDNRDDDRSPPVIRGYKKIGKLSDLETYTRQNRIDLIVVAIPMTAHTRLMQLLPKLWKLPVDVRICGQAIDMKLSPRAYTFLGKLPLLTVFSRPLSANNLLLKRFVDIVIAIALIVILSPIFATVSLAIVLTSKGPPMVRLPRYDFDGNPFGIWRFRTRHDGEIGKDNVPLTPVGRWLRLTSINEMPELFNVLTGQLSIVGPVARALKGDGEIGLYEKVADGYCVRFGIKPGLIGWAQIHGFARKLDTAEKIENRVKYDLEYVDRYSLMFDLRILAKAPFAWLRTKSPQYIV